VTSYKTANKGGFIMTDSDGWGQHSLMVLRELETLSKNIKELRDELQGLKLEIADMRVQKDNVAELKDWKQRIDEVCSPTQLKDLKKEVEDLRLFKTKAITIFAVVQFAMAMALFIQNFM
tara:strand:- start:1240 stop:1599 length:360 start_codon:yes stop_codon:yes gene_type:complete